MVWQSVVGKLWITIIGLVAVVLTLLSLLLVQFIDTYYYQQRSDNLRELAVQITSIIKESPDLEHIHTARELVEAYKTKLVVYGIKEESSVLPPTGDLPNISPAVLIQNKELSKALQGKIGLVRGFFPANLNENNTPAQPTEILAVSVPFSLNQKHGAIILYQTLQELSETTRETTKFILYAAAIGIFLTTIFAFFLSSRITHPLREMQKAAVSFSRGNFTSQIPIRSHDEIGDLALTFNHMAKQLDEVIHALSREKELLFSVLRSMVDGVITIDSEGEILIINPPAEMMLKALTYEFASVEWNQTQSMIGEHIPEPFKPLIHDVIVEKTEKITDIVAQGRTWSVVAAPLYDRDQARGAVVVLRDMTRERQLDKLRKDFIANVSHELRTPLAMLQGYSEAIVDGIAVEPEETKEMAQIIYDESVRMSRLVNDLLDLGRMEAGYIELSKEIIEIAPFVDRITRKFAVAGKERQVTVAANLMGLSKDAVFLLDVDRMEQVFTNLIDNALRHTQPGGKVSVNTKISDEQLYIEVQDTGSGIPEEDLPFVFERFYKADKARTRGRSGTGLGLSIVRQIVQAHGGKITVHSKMGEGTTFLIKIPKE
jgi:two-component system, OmpR family, sensor histidine kinase ResE